MRVRDAFAIRWIIDKSFGVRELLQMPRKSTNEKPIVVSTGAAAAAPARRKPTPKRAPRAAEVSAAAVEMVAEPAQEAIAKLAYSYWEARGCQGGCAEEDWLRAELELRATSVR
jgi:hypothetical protein